MSTLSHGPRLSPGTQTFHIPLLMLWATPTLPRFKSFLRYSIQDLDTKFPIHLCMSSGSKCTEYYLLPDTQGTDWLGSKLAQLVAQVSSASWLVLQVAENWHGQWPIQNRNSKFLARPREHLGTVDLVSVSMRWNISGQHRTTDTDKSTCRFYGLCLPSYLKFYALNPKRYLTPQVATMIIKGDNH